MVAEEKMKQTEDCIYTGWPFGRDQLPAWGGRLGWMEPQCI